MRLLVSTLILTLTTVPAWAAEREVIRTEWSGFQKQIADRRLTGHSARVTTGTKSVKTEVRGVSDTELVVRATRGTKQWSGGSGEARIPKDEVTSVRFDGRVGKKRLVGALAGLGAGAGIAAVTVAQTEVSEGVGIILIPIFGVAIAAGGALAGYFIGCAADQPAPEFILTK